MSDVDINQMIVTIWWNDAEGMYNSRISGTSTIHKSRYALWAKAHALSWYANDLYRIKVLSTPIGDFERE